MSAHEHSAATVPAGHEVGQASSRGILIFLAGFAVTIAIALFVVWELLVGMMRGTEGRLEPPPVARPQVIPAEPRLQPSPGHAGRDWEDLQALRTEEER